MFVRVKMSLEILDMENISSTTSMELEWRQKCKAQPEEGGWQEVGRDGPQEGTSQAVGATGGKDTDRPLSRRLLTDQYIARIDLDLQDAFIK